MACKNPLSIWLLATLLITVKLESTHENEISIYSTHESGSTNSDTNYNNRDEKEGSASTFVPSFGPIQPPEDYNPFQFHNFGPSPIHAYQYMFSHGYPYACTFPYNEFQTLFVPSQRDYFLDSQQPATLYYPHQHFKFPYAEHYPYYLQHMHHNSYNPHHSEFYPPPPPHPPHVYQHYSSPPHHRIPHNNPHSFHSVVNYGHINLHHGDHYEPHDNGKQVPFQPPTLQHQLSLPGFFRHYFPSTFPYHHETKGSSEEALKPQIPVYDVDDQNKAREVEKIIPK